ncbi:M20 family metallo-hydrolase [Halosegnis marinus]|uniref:M20 family metallo-hydrolase n=1 Tax=Halosegnis marinus TaxID=3034023 RepID=A0ABD5ZP03_9EURY|nr:M20 family metallo-hydrolase [Halosegnis sp. DT85]
MDTPVADAVDAERLREDIEANGRFGAVEGEGHGRTVRTGSEANRRARDRLVGRLEAAGCTVAVDSVGNVSGRWTPASADPEAAPVASGSHLDSVPAGGIFDGPLGVYAALEAVRAMREAGVEPARPVEVVSFTEEEGATFADGLLGSSVAVGERTPDEALALTDADGRTLDTALDTVGYRGEGVLDAAGWDAWLELHVEQHTELEAAGVPAGVVGDITGITHCDVEITGEANHAGSTPMAGRSDALAAASELVLAVEDAARDLAVGDAAPDPAAVGTVGSLSVAPNATNVVPGRAEVGIDVRSTTYASMESLVGVVEDTLARVERERGVGTTLRREFDLEPTPMTPRCRDALRAAGERAGIDTLDLHSGAAHDSMYVARVTDAGMLFAPSRDGLSHTPKEWTDWEDCAAATRVLAEALADLAGVDA